MANALPSYNPWSPTPFDYGRRAPSYFPVPRESGYPRTRPYDYGRKPRGYKTPRRGNRLGRGAWHGFPRGPRVERPAPLFHGTPSKGVPFGNRTWHAPAGPGARLPWKDILRRAGSLIGGAIVVYEFAGAAYDVWGMVSPKEIEPDFRHDSPDLGQSYWFQSNGWNICNWVPSRTPGNNGSSLNRIVQTNQVPSNFVDWCLANGVSTNCAQYFSGTGYADRLGEYHPPHTFAGWYTNFVRKATGTDLKDPVPWRMYSLGSADPLKPPQMWTTPLGVRPVGNVVLPVVSPALGTALSLMPSLRPIAEPSGMPGNVPRWMRPYVRQSQLGHQASNGPGVKPNPVPRPNPGRPPRGVKERKRRWAGRGLLAAGREVLNTTLEACDAIDEVWKALPGHVKWTPGMSGGKNCFHKGRDVYNHFDELDIDEALWNLLKMYGEDYLYGKYFAFSDRVAKRLGFPGWKLDQPITEALSQMPEELRSALLDDISGALTDLMGGSRL